MQCKFINSISEQNAQELILEYVQVFCNKIIETLLVSKATFCTAGKSSPYLIFLLNLIF